METGRRRKLELRLERETKDNLCVRSMMRFVVTGEVKRSKSSGTDRREECDTPHHTHSLNRIRIRKVAAL